MKKRRTARQLCVQSLYLDDITTMGRDDIVSVVSGGTYDDSIIDFYLTLYDSISENIEKIDGFIKENANNWAIDRMAILDRNIIRMAVSEMYMLKTAPVAVIIDEAIEIAKELSTEKSGKFVNGILDSIAKTLKKN